MTLSKQLIFIVSLMFVLVFAGTFTITVDNTRRYLATQLATHAQDTATSLGMSLSPPIASGDVLMMKSMVDAIFDRGYFRAIVVADLQGAILIERRTAVRVAGVPQWFVRRMALNAPGASAKLMAGWRQAGAVRVVAHPGHAYEELWTNTVETLRWSLAALTVAILLTTLLLRLILKPLRAVEAQALAIAEREFPQQERLPRTRELRRVVLAMNRMAGKLEQMISDLYARVERLRTTAYVDPVTGFANQAAFERDLDGLIRDREQHAYAAVILLNLRGLDEANRSLGRSGGDQLISEAGDRIRRSLADRIGIAARLEGARFGLLLPDLLRDEVAEFIAPLMNELATLAAPVAKPRGANAGIAYYGGEESARVLIEQARDALGNAESSGANRWHFYDVIETATGRDVHRAVHWREILTRVVAERAVVLRYQPVKSLDLSVTLGYETLARLPSADGDPIPAGAFLPIAARLGLSEELDRLIVQQVIGHSARQGVENSRFAINLSRSSLLNGNFNQWLCDTLGRHPDSAHRLTFEIPEQVAAAAPELAIEFAAGLRSTGAVLGVDHCGARDFSLRYMKRIKPAYSKVDGAFITGLDTDAQRRRYLRSLVEFMHGLDMPIVAEFVATDAELKAVRALGFDAVQGHLVGPPAAWTAP